MRILLLFVLFPHFLFSQKGIQQEKYWIYRERMKNFVVSGNCAGCGIPSDSRNYTNILSYGDPSYQLGWWIGTLAMEYDLLSKACKDGSADACDYLNQTKKDLFYAIEVINQMDYEAERVWGCTPALNGFLLRDNIHADFGEQIVDGRSVYDHLTESWVPLPDGWRMKCINSPYTSYFNGKSEASVDHLIALFGGLAITKKVFENLPNEACNGCGAFKDGEASFLREVQNISNRIITWLSTHSWILINGCSINTPVQGVTAEHYKNPCDNKDTEKDKCNNPADCIDKGGADGIPSAVGFAAVNKYIQAGSVRQNSANILFADVLANSVTSSTWSVALGSALSDLPMTLATSGNVWHKGNSTKEVAEKIREKSFRDKNNNEKDRNWQHYILLHRYLYGDQYDKNGLVTFPYNYYNCMLDVAPCRGFDGTQITGGNVEWGCNKRLIGDRAGGDCKDCEGKHENKLTKKDECNLDSGNDGNPGWGLEAYNRIDFMYYYNLHNLVSPTLGYGVYYSPIPIKYLALADIDKNNYTERDKKNFMAANTIIAHDKYTIDHVPSDGQGRVTFVAGKHIDLLPGFVVKGGGTLNAYIDETIKAMNCVSLTDPSTSASDALSLTSCHDELPQRIVEQESDQEILEEIDAFNTDLHIQITPNPSFGLFTLSSKKELQNIEIRDVLGNLVYSNNNNIPVNFVIDVSSQPRGIYFLRAVCNNTIYTEKIIIH